MSKYRVENLRPFYTYNIRIAAVTVATGSHSDAIFIQTLEDGEYKQSVLTLLTHIIILLYLQFQVVLPKIWWLPI